MHKTAEQNAILSNNHNVELTDLAGIEDIY